jgi:hypothetical protein
MLRPTRIEQILFFSKQAELVVVSSEKNDAKVARLINVIIQQASSSQKRSKRTDSVVPKSSINDHGPD